MEEFERCPFCGRIPKLIELDLTPPEYYVQCSNFYCVEQQHCYKSKHAAIKAWNKCRKMVGRIENE